MLPQSNMKSLLLIDVSNLIWYLGKSDWRCSSITSSSLSLIVIFTLLLFECIIRSSSLTLEERNLIAIVNCIFHVSEFFRSSMISFKYGLILLKYFSNDSFYFYYHYFHIQYDSSFKSYLFLLVSTCLLFLARKSSWYL